MLINSWQSDLKRQEFVLSSRWNFCSANCEECRGKYEARWWILAPWTATAPSPKEIIGCRSKSRKPMQVLFRGAISASCFWSGGGGMMPRSILRFKCLVRICNFIFSCASDSKTPHQPSTWTVELGLFRQLVFPWMKLSSSTANKLTHFTLLSGGEFCWLVMPR